MSQLPNGRTKGVHRLWRRAVAAGLGVLLAVSAPVTWAEGSSDSKIAFVDNLTNLPADLAYMKAHKMPMMLFFHASYCGYCQMIDNEFIIPLRFDPEFRDHLLIRRIEVDAKEQYIDLDGKKHHYLDFANRLEVRGVPFVLFVGPNGQRIASITGTAPGFYDYYLSQDAKLAIECAHDMSPAKCHDPEGGPNL